jgi:hypothetical protein
MFHKETYRSVAKSAVQQISDLHTINSAVNSSVPKRVQKRVSVLKEKVSDIFPKGRLGNHLNLMVRAQKYDRMLEKTTAGLTDNSLSKDLKNFTSLLQTGSTMLNKVRKLKEKVKLQPN